MDEKTLRSKILESYDEVLQQHDKFSTRINRLESELDRLKIQINHHLNPPPIDPDITIKNKPIREIGEIYRNESPSPKRNRIRRRHRTDNRRSRLRKIANFFGLWEKSS